MVEEKYRRGDLVKSHPQPKHNPDKVVNRGEAMEIMLQSDGWKYLRDWWEFVISENTKVLIDIRQDDINKINDLRVLLAVYKGMLKRPQEWIDAKNLQIKKGGNN